MDKKLTMTAAVQISQFEQLHVLRDRTKRSASALVREALELLFAKYQEADVASATTQAA